MWADLGDYRSTDQTGFWKEKEIEDEGTKAFCGQIVCRS
jgi:hypothetical protein